MGNGNREWGVGNRKSQSMRDAVFAFPIPDSPFPIPDSRREL
ncbi:hypothetical protein [Lysobacter gummosus]